jgi:hypothetical protein
METTMGKTFKDIHPTYRTEREAGIRSRMLGFQQAQIVQASVLAEWDDITLGDLAGLDRLAQLAKTAQED